jgi:hypothetical protein
MGVQSKDLILYAGDSESIEEGSLVIVGWERMPWKGID